MVDRASGRAAARPSGQRQPTIRAGLEGGDGRYPQRRGIVLEIMIQKRPQHMQPEILGRVAAKANLPDRAAVEPFLVMEPGTDDQIKIGTIGMLRPERFVKSNIAVNILLVPQAVHQHDGYRDASFGEDLIQRLLLPEGVIGWVGHDLGSEAYLLETVQPRHVARCAYAQPCVIVIIVIGPPRKIAAASRFLVMKIRKAVETKRAVVEQVLAPPAVHRG